jgi:glycosyltransferase involved in cell wall biosynthesis
MPESADRPAVDVIIPVFNGAPFIDRALTSVFEQETDATLTLYLIDDASTDDSRQVIERRRLADDRIHLIAHPVNAGVSIARNAGVRAGSSAFIAFLDQDDEWLADKLSRQLSVLRDDPAVGFVVGRQEFRLAPGHERPRWCRPEWLREPQAGSLPSALLVRRSVFDAVGAFDESLRTGGDDSDWFARARRQRVPSVALEEPVMIRHVHDANLSSSPTTNDELLRLVRRHVSEREGSS